MRNLSPSRSYKVASSKSGQFVQEIVADGEQILETVKPLLVAQTSAIPVRPEHSQHSLFVPRG